MTGRCFANTKTMGAFAYAYRPGYSLGNQEEHMSLRVEQPGQCCETHCVDLTGQGLVLFAHKSISVSCGCWILPHKCLECGMSCDWPDDAQAVRFPQRHCTPHHAGCLGVAGPMLLAFPWPGSTRRGLAVGGKMSQSMDQDQACPLFKICINIITCNSF